MDDIRNDTSASKTGREPDTTAAGNGPCMPRHRRVGPESEVRGGPEATAIQDAGYPIQSTGDQGPDEA
jgi:hypothetical protein